MKTRRTVPSISDRGVQALLLSMARSGHMVSIRDNSVAEVWDGGEVDMELETPEEALILAKGFHMGVQAERVRILAHFLCSQEHTPTADEVARPPGED